MFALKATIAVFTSVLACTFPQNITNHSSPGRRFEQIGQYVNPITNVIKRYYLDDAKVSWTTAQKFCKDLSLQPLTIESQAELEYLFFLPRLADLDTYYWTAGIETIGYKWDIDSGISIFPEAEWCTTKKSPACISLHRTVSLHDLDCTTLHPPICQAKL